jgi:hypothetical protein
VRRRGRLGRLRRFRFPGRIGLVTCGLGLEFALGLSLPRGPLEGLLSLRHQVSSVVSVQIERAVAPARAPVPASAEPTSDTLT